MKYLIVGLGNIGDEYHETRHNIGFMVLDALAKASNIVFKDGRYGATASLSLKGRQLILLKPSTYMNLSGNAVRYWMQQEKIPLENVLIVVDDLALPLGSLRLKGKGIVSMKDSAVHGNQYVTVQIQVPQNLSPEAKEKLREFQQVLRKDTQKRRGSAA